jgi:tetratricopeptide (TPR) repeat protein
MYEQNGVSPSQRLGIIEQHAPVINRDDVISREINLDIFAGKYDSAIGLMKSRFFRSWEGGQRYSLGDSWVNANILRGRSYLAEKKYQEALADFQSAAQIPANLQDAAGNVSGRASEISYWIGVAQESLGNAKAAEQSWHDAANPPAAVQNAGFAGRGGGRGGRGRGSLGGLAAGVRVPDAALYYQALALQKLGESEKANGIFQQLIASESKISAAAGPSDGASNPEAALAQHLQMADAYFLAGLGYLGINDKAAAQQRFNRALILCPDYLAAHVMLQN